jgi:nucleoside-triphosphatase THEP1
MVHIITGKVNSGKTTSLRNQFAKHPGEGFFLAKVFFEDKVIGQDIVSFTTGQFLPFSRKKNWLPENWDEIGEYRNYSFSQKGLDFAKEIFERALKEQINPLYLDEIGPLELKGEGFSDILKKCLASEAELYLAVRTGCLKDVLKSFDIRDYELIHVNS